MYIYVFYIYFIPFVLKLIIAALIIEVSWWEKKPLPTIGSIWRRDVSEAERLNGSWIAEILKRNSCRSILEKPPSGSFSASF